MRRLRALANVGAHAIEPADQDQVEVLVAAEMVVDAAAPLEQSGQDIVEVGDRVRVVHAEAFNRAFLAGARPIPRLLGGIAFPAEQQALAMLATGHEHQHRLGFGESGEVPEVAVLPERKRGVLAADALGRGGQDQDRIVPGHAHQLLAAFGELGILDHRGGNLN